MYLFSLFLLLISTEWRFWFGYAANLWASRWKCVHTDYVYTASVRLCTIFVQCEQSGKLHTMDLMLLALFSVRAAGSIQIRSNRNATKKVHKKGGIESRRNGDCGLWGYGAKRMRGRQRGNEKIYTHFTDSFVHIAPTMCLDEAGAGRTGKEK